MLIPKIGLEIHTEVKTKSKMFCSCPNTFETQPNRFICPVCTGQPGALPTINKQAVFLTLKLGLALGGKINYKTYFVRKNYYYPDLPKNYQISQYELPFVEGGVVKFFLDGKETEVFLKRIHLEEDAGRLIHFGDFSLIDFNRAGAPLIEIVTLPCLKTSEQAKMFAQELILILRYLNISEANPEKGQIRFEANISVGPNDELGTRVEVKNLNSLKSLKEAIDYEIERQVNLIKKGEKVVQETRGWDEVKRITFVQREKEEAQDYRYFPEPDLVPLDLTGLELEREKLPFDLRKELIEEYGLSYKESEILIWEPWALDLFKKTASFFKKNSEAVKQIFNYLTTDIFSLYQTYKENKITPEDFKTLVDLNLKGKISSRIFKEILQKIFKGEKLNELLNIYQKITDPQEIEKILKDVIKENQSAVQDYKKGKINSFEFIIGQAMKMTSGKIDPNLARKVLKDLLDNL